MLAHDALTKLLHAAITWAWEPAVWNLGAAKDGTNPLANIEPRVSANLSNQFEWPLFFYVACLLAIFLGMGGNTILISLAWLFVVGRVLHSAVQIFTTNIRLRGLVFTLNFVAVIGMWLYMAYHPPVLS
ncbi:MAG: MAPEG family protein [Pseudomonadota bacterium]